MMFNHKIAETPVQSVATPITESTQSTPLDYAAALPAAAQVLLLLQHQRGNHYVQHLVNQTQQAPAMPSGSLPVQTKLVLGPVGDKYEQEADRVAHEIVFRGGQANTPNATPQLSLQRQTTGLDSPVTPEIETTIRQAQGNGQVLPSPLQNSMGQALGADFSRVRVHTDSRADSLNHDLQARAFTTGQDIFFRRGEYSPNSPSGQSLLAHELTHVVQQSQEADHVQRVVFDENNGQEMTLDELLRKLNWTDATKAKITQMATAEKLKYGLKDVEAAIKNPALKIPGIDALTDADYRAAKDAVTPNIPGDEAKTVAESKQRMAANRKRWEDMQKNQSDEIKTIENTFKNTTFHYGTTGEQDKNDAPVTTIVQALEASEKARLNRTKLEIYQPGIRQLNIENKVGGTKYHEMMDMYYGGQQYDDLQLGRNPLIGKYIHEMMGYAGEYTQLESGDVTFRKNYPHQGDQWGNKQGWAEPSAQLGAWGNLTGTKEISRLIREGVKNWGGKIVMEVKNVPWDNIFGSRSRYGDTDAEIEAFMPEYLKSKNAKTPWGKGEVIWTYGGQEEPLTKSRVRNDFWFGPYEKNTKPPLTQTITIPGNVGDYIKNRVDAYNDLPEGDASQRWKVVSPEKMKNDDLKKWYANSLIP